MSKTVLYPLTFKSIFKEKIWGGQKINTFLGKDFSPLNNCGESWEMSGVKGDVSIVANGVLSGKSLNDLILEYKEELLGYKVYEVSKNEFPLLIKFLDANADLSIQVHPDDQLALERHNSLGKTEMWYVLQADKQASLITGFNRPLSREEYISFSEDGRLTEILNREEVKGGDVFFIPAGRVHTIGEGLLIAEIQQTSDITYRIFDFDRVDSKGQKRELHTDLAIEAIDYDFYEDYKTSYDRKVEGLTELVSSAYFETNCINITSRYESVNLHDSFKIFIGVEGSCQLHYDGLSYDLNLGDVVLIPASLGPVTLEPSGESKILETYVPTKKK